MNDIAHLIRLANRIAAFFEAMPDRAEALEGIASHIQKFWPPGMRAPMLAFLDAHPDGILGDIALKEIAREAINRNRQRLMPSGIPPT
ncbi:formate dehydrogenase [Pusillimonas sp. TS35]|uniref:formate dehydrogenase subunit delta n=1 Tax=Paracandidimonas lactea TaxID=2895524 RepID=UPI00136CE49E|nr:formate dehydrogenase subunit delta [Paracandidimonas lactea]MYN14596.1 formate dehydrogenase [Pusillimonas sp. TS35]